MPLNKQAADFVCQNPQCPEFDKKVFRAIPMHITQRMTTALECVVCIKCGSILRIVDKPFDRVISIQDATKERYRR